MKASALFEDKALPADLDVVEVRFTPQSTTVDLQSYRSGRMWRVEFAGAVGHRLLDEGALLEFWPGCSTPNGCIFRIESGGWFEQECGRQGFLLRDTQPHLPEYFVTGENGCVSVLSHSPPELMEVLGAELPPAAKAPSAA